MVEGPSEESRPVHLALYKFVAKEVSEIKPLKLKPSRG
jgi:hypothetical protein